MSFKEDSLLDLQITERHNEQVFRVKIPGITDSEKQQKGGKRRSSRVQAEVHRGRVQDIKGREIILNIIEQCFGTAGLQLGHWLNSGLRLISRKINLPGVCGWVFQQEQNKGFVLESTTGSILCYCCYGAAHVQIAQEGVLGMSTSTTSHAYPLRAVFTKLLT